jgi:ABC-type glutathione transport system ATPase component
MTQSVLEFHQVTKRFGQRVAVDDVSFAVGPASTVGVVGQSGSGKTTLLRLALGLDAPSAGMVTFHGKRYASSRQMTEVRKRIGVVFQDPYDSLNPRLTIGEIVAEPLRVHRVRSRQERRRRVEAALEAAGLPGASLENKPSAYSGGGRQRIAIARAIILEPELLLCDEPTASLDVSVQAQIVNLLLDLRARLGMAMLFVSHDLDLARKVSTHMVVMRHGKVVEAGSPDDVVRRPRDAYTRALIDAIPTSHPRDRKILSRPAPELPHQ